MKKIVSSLKIMVLWVFLTPASYAEVIVHEQAITAHLERSSLSQVLMKIGQQAGIDIAVTKGSDYRKAVVSEVLENVPLEEGLSRLLNGWNYGLVKNANTGAIHILMVVSRRTEVKPPSVNAQVQVMESRFEQENPEHNWEEWNSSDLADQPKYLTDEDLLNNAIPEVRKLIEEMQKGDWRTVNGR